MAHTYVVEQAPDPASNTSPPAFRKYFLGVLVVQSLLLGWALAHHFIPGEYWHTLGFYCNIVSSVVLSGSLYWLLWQRRTSDLSIFRRIFVVLASPLLLYFMGYVSWIYGAGDAYTKLVGHPANMADVWHKNMDDDARFQKEYTAAGVYEKRYFDNRKGCITRFSSPTLMRGLPPNFCVSGKTFARLPQQVPVMIYGLSSQAGFDLQQVVYQP